MDRLLLLCAALALYLPSSASDRGKHGGAAALGLPLEAALTFPLSSPILFPPSTAVRCGRPKDVANAIINADDTSLLHTSLRYTCKMGYKRKAGTSTLIQCILDQGKPVWTSTELQCIRKWSYSLLLDEDFPEAQCERKGRETPAALSLKVFSWRWREQTNRLCIVHVICAVMQVMLTSSCRVRVKVSPLLISSLDGSSWSWSGESKLILEHGCDNSCHPALSTSLG
uniref:Sushi domain-containing protein n=1 Tax=Coturnix japonica TaxID=93934 RepID=A0A8C2Y6P1_COTJA